MMFRVGDVWALVAFITVRDLDSTEERPEDFSDEELLPKRGA